MFFKTLGQRFIAGGDYNAKNTFNQTCLDQLTNRNLTSNYRKTATENMAILQIPRAQKATERQNKTIQVSTKPA